jgi:membrane associated rhomboid family serine protease
MFPIRDHNPSEKTPYVVFALIAINVAVFLYDLLFVPDGMPQGQFYYDYALVPALVSNGEGLTGILTHMFLHGGPFHIAGNMLFLWVFGDNLEEEMGHLGFLVFYLLSGLGAAFFQYVAEPFSQIPMVGASGAIAGVMGGYLLMFPKARVDVLIWIVIFIRIIPIPAWLMLMIWFGLQIWGGLGTPLDGGGVAYWAHAGGFIIGMALSVPLWLRRGGPRYWDRVGGHPPHPEARYRFETSRVPSVRRRR